MSGGFLLLMALLWYLGMEETLFWCLLASALHELGHALAARRMGVSIRRLRITAVGAEMVLCPTRMLSYPGEMLIALAGPAVNLFTAALAVRLPWEGQGRLLFAGASAALGAFNLLPLGPLDGGQLLRAALSLLISPEAGRIVTEGLTLAGTAALLGAGVWLLAAGEGNLSLLVIGGWLCAGAAGQRRKEGKRGLAKARIVG